MNILITNDDGVGAGQLVPLIRWCQKLGNVTAAVPKFEQSGKSHSIEIHKPFEAKKVELVPGAAVWAVDSTPADCVRFACSGLGLTFDLVISGVNRGLNLGHDIMYSGTFAAACEAVNNGMKALAISTTVKGYPRATEHLDWVFACLQEHRLLEQNDLYNINIPEDPKGIRITRQGGPYFLETFRKLENDLYLPVGSPIQSAGQDPTLDTVSHRQGYISITPMTTDRTKESLFRALTAQIR